MKVIPKTRRGQVFSAITALAVVVGGVAGAAGISQAAAKPKITKSVIYYWTYIPNNTQFVKGGMYIDGPGPGPGCANEWKKNGKYLNKYESGATEVDHWYNTNNRSQPKFKSGDYKTEVVLTFDFKKADKGDGDSDGFGYTAKAAVTKRFVLEGGKYLPRDQKQAPIDVEVARAAFESKGLRGAKGPAFAEFTVGHASPNAYCVRATDINWTMSGKVSRNGKISIAGSHDKMPNHEIWREDHYTKGKPKTKLLYSSVMKDPKCLVFALGPIDNCLQNWKI